MDHNNVKRIFFCSQILVIKVHSHIALRPNRTRNYCIRFNFLPKDAYESEFAVTPKGILKYMKEVFFKLMFKAIAKAANEKYSS